METADLWDNCLVDPGDSNAVYPPASLKIVGSFFERSEKSQIGPDHEVADTRWDTGLKVNGSENERERN